MRRIIVLFVFLLISSQVFAKKGGDPKYPDPEDIVIFESPAIACNSKESFSMALKYLYGKEKTKLKGMFDDLTCIILPENEKFKVLSREGFLLRYIEIVSVRSDYTEGLWTSPDLVKQIVAE